MSILLVFVHTLSLLANSNAQIEVENTDTESVMLPIDFRNLPKDGAGDPTSKLKQPYEPDPYLLIKDMYKSRVDTHFNNKSKIILHPAELFDIQELSISRKRGNPTKLKEGTNVTAQMSHGRFHLEENIVLENWTSCEEFAKEAYFHPQDVTGIDWIPFYQWSVFRAFDDAIRRYAVPLKKVVAWYKQEFDAHMRNIDWSQPKLLMTVRDLETLLIAIGRQGKFRVLPKYSIPQGVPYGFKFPEIVIHMKLVDEKYLVLMDCDSPFAIAMAAKDDIPRTYRAKSKAIQAINFRGNEVPPPPMPRRESVRPQQR